MKYYQEIQPTATYADDKKRKFYFLGWQGHDLKGYGRVVTVEEDGEGFDENGEWGKIGEVFASWEYVHKSKIKPLDEN